jgi:hypothetical protein
LTDVIHKCGQQFPALAVKHTEIGRGGELGHCEIAVNPPPWRRGCGWCGRS